MDIKTLLKEDIINALASLEIDTSKDIIVIEEPKNKNNGDFSSNVAMKLAGILKDNPMNIANKIVNELKQSDNYEVCVAAPGFINFKLTNKYVFSGIKSVIDSDIDYGRNNYGMGRKINIEFVSANPTGILHLGTARGASYGSNLSNIMSFAGYDVTRVNGTCKYTKTTNLTCPEKSGYSVSQSGSTCTYTRNVSPVCAEREGFNVSRSGFTCTYTKTVEQEQQFIEQRTGSWFLVSIFL